MVFAISRLAIIRRLALYFIEKNMQNLTDNLVARGYLKTPQIIEAFRKIDRADFTPERLKEDAYIDAPLPIGYGQTISQPSTVAFMLELLRPKTGDKILDIGAGSGWQTVILSYIVGEEGKVFAVERISELAEFGKDNVSKYNFIEKGIAEFICSDGCLGLPQKAPFDKIIAAAAGEEIPQAWKEQLKIGGVLVTPQKSSVFRIVKKGKNKFEEEEYPGFAFVPLIRGL